MNIGKEPQEEVADGALNGDSRGPALNHKSEKIIVNFR